MKNLFFVLLLMSIAFNIKAQQINGYVTDANTGEVLIGANVYASRSKTVTVTNTFGFFSILLHNTDSLVVSYVGYRKKKTAFSSIKIIPLHIKLKPQTNIDKVIVTAARLSIQETPEMSIVSIPMQQLKTIPSLAGETDIMKTLQLMPGIKSLGEGQSSFMVRGGSPDQNMVILDKVPLYYINHFGGFVSVFNSDALNDVKMYKGAFPARYGGRLSSIIDINTKDGNLNERHTSLTLGLITSKIMFEGPIKKDTLSYFISGRRFMYDLISRPITYLTNEKKQFGYTFYDINAKINYKPNKNNRLYISFYSGHDKMLNKQKKKDDENSLMKNISKWGNLTSSVRWNHIYGLKLFSNISLYYMQYKYKSEFEYSYDQDDNRFVTISDFCSNINDIGLNTDFEYYIHPKISFRFGSNHIYHTYKPNNYQYSQSQNLQVSTFDISSKNKQIFNAVENSIYTEIKLPVSKYFSCNIGYRATAFTTINNTYISHEPRTVLNINLPSIFSVKAGYSRMSQYVHLLTYFGASIPADLWMPSTETIPPQYSDIYSIGIYKKIMNADLEISVECYYKELNNLIEYKPGYNIFGSTEDWTNAVEQNGIGESKGIEFLIQRKTGRLSGWISYTISKTTRQFENINNGKPYLYTYDATHDFSIVTVFKLKEKLSLSATWSYMTGRAITMPNEEYNIPVFNFDNEINSAPFVNYSKAASYEQKNNIRMNPYHRLDISLTYKKHKKRSDRILSLGIYNLYSRQNAIYYFIAIHTEKDEMGRPVGQTEKKIYQRSLFPIIPSISYTWIW